MFRNTFPISKMLVLELKINIKNVNNLKKYLFKKTCNQKYLSVNKYKNREQ